MLAQVPDAPDSPHESGVSDTQILLRWKQPKHDGNSPVLCYSVQYKSIGESSSINNSAINTKFLPFIINNFDYNLINIYR